MAITDELLVDAKDRMAKSVESSRGELATVRTGRREVDRAAVAEVVDVGRARAPRGDEPASDLIISCSNHLTRRARCALESLMRPGELRLDGRVELAVAAYGFTLREAEVTREALRRDSWPSLSATRARPHS